jgi:SOS-response transcriptional repressor LexA
MNKKNSKDYIFLSKVKADVLNYIANFVKEKNYSPTLIEIGNRFGFTRSRSNAIVNDLAKANLLSKDDRYPQRKIKLSNQQLTKISSLKVNEIYPVNEI